MPGYRWICHICKAANSPAASECARCHAQSDLSAIQIEGNVRTPTPGGTRLRGFARWVKLVALLVPLMLLVALAAEAGMSRAELGLVIGVAASVYLWSKGALEGMAVFAARVLLLTLCTTAVLAIAGDRNAVLSILGDHALMVLAPMGWMFAVLGVSSLLAEMVSRPKRDGEST